MRHGAQQAAVNQSTNDNYKILVVDDEEGILDSLSIFLKRSGYQFVGITDPVEAIERVKQEHFDLLVLDFIMTPLHGDQVVEEIRKFNKELYILLLTGHKDLAPPLETIKRLDIQGYCEKSDKFDQVILLIESGIKSVAQMREIQRINEELKDIIVSGYTEKEENRYIFNLMKWWVYLKFDHYYVVLNSNNGNITFEEQEDIICKFDIEEEDLFTVFSWSDLAGQEYGVVKDIDTYYDVAENLVGLGIKMPQFYLLFNALNIDGFIISVEENNELIYQKITYSKKVSYALP